MWRKDTIRYAKAEKKKTPAALVPFPISGFMRVAARPTKLEGRL